MKEFLEGSQAVARAVAMARPGVIAAYPITPQTHIVEELAQMVADGELKTEFVNVESEHSAASVVLGSEACGVRSFSASSSQGLLLLSEVLYCIAGLRLPLVLTCANRAVSAPINIWNDHQDSFGMRDTGWIQMHAETGQEVLDLHLQAYRIGEDERVQLPVMVCMDGYILTHAYEVVDVPEQAEVDRFLPSYKPVEKLDPENPISMGVLAGPEAYMETRYAIQETMQEALPIIEEISQEFEKRFGRKSGGLLETYKMEDADRVLVVCGSMAGTVRVVVDEMRAGGEKVGMLKLITYRPFPEQQIVDALSAVPQVGVLEKSISLGSTGPVLAELRAGLQGRSEQQKVSGFIIGLGGRDVTKASVREVYETLAGPQVDAGFIGLKPEILTGKA